METVQFELQNDNDPFQHRLHNILFFVTRSGIYLHIVTYMSLGLVFEKCKLQLFSISGA